MGFGISVFFGCGGNEDSDGGNSNSFVEYKSCLDCGKLIKDKSLGCQECPLETEENISGRDDNAEKKELDKLYWQFINDAHEKLGISMYTRYRIRNALGTSWHIFSW